MDPNEAAAKTAAGTTNASSSLSLKVRIVDFNITKTLQFTPSTLVFDALKIIREKIPETNTANGNFNSFNSKFQNKSFTLLRFVN